MVKNSNSKNVPLSDKVRYVRMKMGLTQEKLAKNIDVPVNTIIKWENDIVVKPNMVNYGKLINYCEKHNIDFKKIGGVY